MPNWGGMTLTKKGLNLQAKVEAGTTLTLIKVKVGDGTLGSGQILENLDDLISPKQVLPITSINAQDGGVCKITANMTNISLESGYYVREMGLFATDPDLGEILYAISMDTSPDYLPPEGEAVVVTEELEINVGIGNATNITANIDPTGIVTSGVLENHNASESAHEPAFSKHNIDETAHPFLLKRGWPLGRNMILTGPVDSSGTSEILKKADSTTLKLQKDALLSFAAGFNDRGPVDYVEEVTADITKTFTVAGDGLTSTYYLLADRNPITGEISLVATKQKPRNIEDLGSNIVADLNVFNPVTGQALLYDGSQWIIKQRIPLGEATIDSTGNIISITSYGVGLAGIRVKDAERADAPVALGQLTANLSSNGYVKIPAMFNGGKFDFIIQWGLSSSIPDDSEITVTFPIVFPNLALNVVATNRQANIVNGGWIPYIDTISKNGFVVGADDVSASSGEAIKVYWQAIGY